jgi:hypothetical protein
MLSSMLSLLQNCRMIKHVSNCLLTAPRMCTNICTHPLDLPHLNLPVSIVCVCILVPHAGKPPAASTEANARKACDVSCAKEVSMQVCLRML